VKIFRDAALKDESQEAALAGTLAAAMPHKVFDPLFRHPLAGEGQGQFLKNGKKAKAQWTLHNG
jgi:hypothetical protein